MSRCYYDPSTASQFNASGTPCSGDAKFRVHDRRGCVLVCAGHAAWRGTTSRAMGHSSDCPNARDEVWLHVTRDDHNSPSVDDLIAQGAKQMSRWCRRVARLPPGMSGLQALRARAPERYRDVMQRAEEWAAEEYRRYVADKHGDEFTLSVHEFAEFLSKTGRTKWQPNSEPCPHCYSYGHEHARFCPNRGKRS